MVLVTVNGNHLKILNYTTIKLIKFISDSHEVNFKSFKLAGTI